MIPIRTGSGSGTRQILLKAASERNDAFLQGRLAFHADLFAADAKYHASCYSAYVSDRNIAAYKRKIDPNAKNLLNPRAETDAAYEVLFSEIQHDVILGEQSTTLSKLSERYAEILIELDVNHTHSQSSSNLRKKLQTFFGQQLTFTSCAGKYTIVNSQKNEYNVACSAVDTDLTSDENDLTDDEVIIQDNETLILHKAAGILRQKILHHSKNVPKMNYKTPQSINEQTCREEVPDELYQFITWILSGELLSESTTKPFDINVVAICSSILSGMDQYSILILDCRCQFLSTKPSEVRKL